MRKPKQKTEWKSVSVRLRADDVETMERIRARVQESPEYRGKVTVSNAMILRLAFLEGIAIVSKQFPA